MARRNPLERFNRGTVTTRCVRDRLSYSAGPPDETAGPQNQDRRHYRPGVESPETLERLIRAGLNIARLNFSHADFTGHADRIARIRAAEKATGRRVAIMADLPGPKMRVGKIEPEPIQLLAGESFTLTRENVVGDARRFSMSFDRLPDVVKSGDRLFLNDGLVELVVERAAGNDVQCKVAIGGELRSKKGLNLAGIDLGISAFTDHDRACLEFALANGVDAINWTAPTASCSRVSRQWASIPMKRWSHSSAPTARRIAHDSARAA